MHHFATSLYPCARASTRLSSLRLQSAGLLVLRANQRVLSFPLTRAGLHIQERTISYTPRRRNADAPPPTSTPSETKDVGYVGPLASTFRRLKIFSISSLALSFSMTPFLFVVESSLPNAARIALAATALGTSSISTALVAWCGSPYVTNLRRLIPAENDGAEGLEMTTLSLTLQPRITKVYDSDFLTDTKRAFAKWELADEVVLPQTPIRPAPEAGLEETVAETFDKRGKVLGRWIVSWGENGEGKCRAVGSVVRYFNVHEELIN